MNKKIWILGLQHVLAMYAGAIVVPLIIGNALNFTTEQLSLLVSADLFTCGIATILQAQDVNKYIGIRLPVIMGCAFSAVPSMLVIGKHLGILYIYGSIIISGIFIIALASFFKTFARFFTPISVGLIITLIGLALIPVAIDNILGSYHSINEINFLQNFGLAIGVIIFIVIANKYFNDFLKSIAVLLGLIFGTIIAIFLGIVDLSIISEAQWIHYVKPFNFGFPKFSLHGILAMCLVSFISLVESVGVFLVLGKISKQEIKDEHIIRGIRAEGIAQILGGIFNSFPYTTFSQNIGLIIMSKITDRKVGICAGIILIILGMIPKVAALVTLIPGPILGGIMIPMFGLVTAYGIKIIQDSSLENSNNLLIIAITLGVSMGIIFNQSKFEQAPDIIKILFSNGVLVGGIISIFLNIILNNKK